jgi:FkbM family methyltransferase
MNLTKYFKLIIPPFIFILFKKMKIYPRDVLKLKESSKKYSIGNYQLNIPINHTLPQNQLKNRLYDRFLPILVKNLDSNKIIVDIGANIGDTLFSMLPNCENPIYCIEPSDYFYSYLKTNINILLKKDNNRVKCFKTFVGTGLFKGELEHTFGTASVKLGDKFNMENYISLDGLIDDHMNVGLIKVDTDGYDFDVLKSAENLLEVSRPILFWENQMFEDFQVKGFEEMYSLLNNMGYKYIYIFDNFGNLIMEEASFEVLQKINSYVLSMDQGKSTRTFYYTDILASTDKNYYIVKNAINEYKSYYINA